jgi:tetratricopeptide (TPR) repeat protein
MMQRLNASLVACVVLLSVLGSVAGIVHYRQLGPIAEQQQAEDALAERDFARAREHLQKFLQLRPESGQIQFLLGRTCRRAGDLDEARVHLDEARKLGWVKEQIDLEYRLLQAQSGLVRKVEGPLRETLRQGHQDATVILEALVIGCLQANFLTDAYRWTTTWIEAFPDDWQAHFWQGCVLEAGLRYELAAAEYERVLAKKPDYPEANYHYAEMLHRKGRPAEALSYYAAALRHDPQNPAALFGLARCQRVVATPEVARATLERLFAVQPEHASGLLLRGQLELDAGNTAVALPWLQRAAKAAPQDMDICQTLATTLRLLKRNEEAQVYERRKQEIEKNLRRMEALTKQIAERPDDVALRCEAGTILLRLEQPEQAARWLGSALLLDPHNATAQKALADCLEKLGDPRLAEHYRRLVEKSANAPRS